MENNHWVFVVLVFLAIWFWREHHNLKNLLAESQDELSSCEDESLSYQDALDQANSNIEDAQSYAWSSYEDMGYALDNLEIVNP